ncbi:TIR domain-containing protein [Corynebacteriaceae bacterium 7-707]
MTTAVYYSFHHRKDADRVRSVSETDGVRGQPLLDRREWDEVKAGGNRAVKEWIDEKMAAAEAVVVLVGADTAVRHWVRYEIRKAWEDGRPLLGVRIHGLASSTGGADEEGEDPFGRVEGVHDVPLFDPTRTDADGVVDTQATLENLRSQLPTWVTRGVTRE